MSTLRLAFVIDAVDRATAKVAAVNRVIDRITEPAKRVRAAFTSLVKESKFDRLRDAIGEVGERTSALRGFGSTVLGVFAAIGVAAGGVFYALKSTIDQIDRTLDVSKKLGMGVAQYQRLGYAAQLNGSNQEEMGMALQFLSQNMVEAINGSKEAQVWFTRVGIPLQQLKRMNAAQVFEVIADKFKSVGDAGQNAEKKIAVMRALMGRGGAELKQVLDLGSDGLKQFYAEADRLGAVVSQDVAESMADFNDNADRMRFSLFGVMATISRVALPALEALVGRITEWAVANREVIGTRVAAFVDQLIGRLPGFITAVVQIAGALVAVTAAADAVAQAIGGWETVIAIILGLVGGKLLLLLATLMTSLWGLGAAFLATPFGWFAAGVAGVIALAVLLVKNWQPVMDFFERLGAIVGRVWAAFTGGARPPGLGLATDEFGNAITGSDESQVGQIDDATRRNQPSLTRAPSALPQQPAELAGKVQVDIRLDQDGRARVAKLRADTPQVEADVYSGMAMGGAG